MSSDHHGIKIEINHRKNFGEFTNTLKVNNTLPNNEQVKKETTKHVRNYVEMNKNEDKYNELIICTYSSA